MGQKIHPEGFRVGYIHDWKSNWFDERNFADPLLEDMAIRDHIESKLSHAGLSDINDRQAARRDHRRHPHRPPRHRDRQVRRRGRRAAPRPAPDHQKPVKVNIREIKRPELDAKLVAQSIAEQLQNRVAFRRAMKRALTSAMRSGAKGVKVQVSGRLGGAEMARTEGYSDGRVPLHTLRADIDYGFVEAKTTTGRIGVKCWINKGEVMPEGYRAGGDEEDLAPRSFRRRGRRPAAAAASAAASVAAAAVRDGPRPAERRTAPRQAPPAEPAAAPARAARRPPSRSRHRPPPPQAPRRGTPRRRASRPRPPAEAAPPRRAGRARRPSARSRRPAGRERRAEPRAAAGPAPTPRAPPEGDCLMLMPKRVKHRKQMRGKRRGNTKGGAEVAFGEYGLKALERGWITNRQIEAARVAMTRKIKRGGKVWINIFPDKPYTKKPAETRHGLRQGQPRGLGRRGQARQGDVRARRRARGPRQGGDAPRRPQASRSRPSS